MKNFIISILISMVVSSCGAGMTEADRDFARKVVKGIAAGSGGGYTPSANRSGTAHFSHSYTQGFNKVCVYDRLGSVDTLVIGATGICPLTI